jgi:uncharacterized membrane protein
MLPRRAVRKVLVRIEVKLACAWFIRKYAHFSGLLTLGCGSTLILLAVILSIGAQDWVERQARSRLSSEE